MKRPDFLHAFLFAVSVLAVFVAASTKETDHVEQLNHRLEAKQQLIKELCARSRQMLAVYAPGVDAGIVLDDDRFKQWQRSLVPSGNAAGQDVREWSSARLGDPDR